MLIMIVRYHHNLKYYQHGENPAVLFLSGMHGDESESVLLLNRYLKTELTNLPDFAYIPRVSPTAVLQKTRQNAQGHDINRYFLQKEDDQEAQNVIEVLSPYDFRRVIDIHEDPDRLAAFYLYDTGVMDEDELMRYRALVHTTGARLYTGVDDMEDQTLGYHVEKGYISMPASSIDKRSGFFVQWAHKQFPSSRGFTLEVPGKAKTALKARIIESLVPFLLHV